MRPEARTTSPARSGAQLGSAGHSRAERCACRVEPPVGRSAGRPVQRAAAPQPRGALTRQRPWLRVLLLPRIAVRSSPARPGGTGSDGPYGVLGLTRTAHGSRSPRRIASWSPSCIPTATSTPRRPCVPRPRAVSATSTRPTRRSAASAPCSAPDPDRPTLRPDWADRPTVRRNASHPGALRRSERIDLEGPHSSSSDSVNRRSRSSASASQPSVTTTAPVLTERSQPSRRCIAARRPARSDGRVRSKVITCDAAAHARSNDSPRLGPPRGRVRIREHHGIGHTCVRGCERSQVLGSRTQAREHHQIGVQRRLRTQHRGALATEQLAAGGALQVIGPQPDHGPRSPYGNPPVTAGPCGRVVLVPGAAHRRRNRRARVPGAAAAADGGPARSSGPRSAGVGGVGASLPRPRGDAATASWSTRSFIGSPE